jgi:hypothetical protein
LNAPILPELTLKFVLRSDLLLEVDENTGDCSNLVLLNAPIHSRPHLEFILQRLFHDSLSLLNAQETKILELFSLDGCSSKLSLAVERVWLFQIGFWLLSKWWSLVVVFVPVISLHRRTHSYVSIISIFLPCFGLLVVVLMSSILGGCSGVLFAVERIEMIQDPPLRCRTHRDDSRPASASTVNLFQVALVHPVSSPLKSIRHRLSSEPPTGVDDDGSLAADESMTATTSWSHRGYSSLAESSTSTNLRLARSFRTTATCCSLSAICSQTAALDLPLGTLL